MKVYDCFMFFNELDHLEIRLNELNSEVDYFVLVEAERSHQNKIKPLYFDENKNRYKKFLDKIIHVIVPASDFKSDNYWYNENLQRFKITDGLKNASDDDLIIIGDADEIVRNDTLKNLKKNFKEDAYVFDMDIYVWYLNVREQYKRWRDVGILRKKTLDQVGTQIFKAHSRNYTIVPDGGWNFSYLGSPEKMKNKLDNFAHREWSHLTVDALRENKEKLIDALGRTDSGDGLNLVVDRTYEKLPKYVQDNVIKFKEYIHELS